MAVSGESDGVDWGENERAAQAPQKPEGPRSVLLEGLVEDQPPPLPPNLAHKRLRIEPVPPPPPPDLPIETPTARTLVPVEERSAREPARTELIEPNLESRRPPAEVVATLPRKSTNPREKPFKIGIIGARGTGKTFLFQAMAYRASNPRLSGVLTPFLAKSPPELFHRTSMRPVPARLDTHQFLDEYRSWRRLATTTRGELHWYTLRLKTPCGLFGWRDKSMDIELLDAPGELLVDTLDQHRQIWHDAYVGAQVIVFCAPLWIFFPKRDLSEEDYLQRDAAIKGFHRVVHHYLSVRADAGDRSPVQTVLALTMADDDRSCLRSIRDRWITPYTVSQRSFALGGTVSRYLESARRTSEALKDLFCELPDQLLSRLPDELSISKGIPPWFVPVSAIDGHTLDSYEEQRKGGQTPRIFEPPRPVHIELPLLLALAVRDNALM